MLDFIDKSAIMSAPKRGTKQQTDTTMNMNDKYPAAAQAIRNIIADDPWGWFDMVDDCDGDICYIFHTLIPSAACAPCAELESDDLLALYHDITDGKTAFDF